MDAVARWGARGSAWTVTLALHAATLAVAAWAAGPVGEREAGAPPCVDWTTESPLFEMTALETVQPADSMLALPSSCASIDDALDWDWGSVTEPDARCRCSAWDSPVLHCRSCNRVLSLAYLEWSWGCPVHTPGWRRWYPSPCARCDGDADWERDRVGAFSAHAHLDALPLGALLARPRRASAAATSPADAAVERPCEFVRTESDRCDVCGKPTSWQSICTRCSARHGERGGHRHDIAGGGSR